VDHVAFKQDLEDLLGREVDVVTERALHSRIRERVPRIRERVLREVPPSPMGLPLSNEVYQRRSLPRTHSRTDAGSRAYERMQIPHVLIMSSTGRGVLPSEHVSPVGADLNRSRFNLDSLS
jgi:hypothetical protein